MPDQARLVKLFRTGHRCIFLPTVEELEAVQLVNAAAIQEGLDVLLWSASHGLRDGALGGQAPGGGSIIPDTSHPAAAFFHLTTLPRRVIVVFCDAVAHFKDEKTLRLCRETIDSFARTGSHLVLVDHMTDLPPVLRAYATEMEPMLPTDEQLEKMVRNTAREHAKTQGLHIDLSKRDFESLIRNLAGLSLRHARQILIDVMSDGTLDSQDVNRALANKRKLLEGASALEYVESPVSLDEIGGLSRLKSWLLSRKDAICGNAREFGITPPRGMLMLGVQGAGKSLSAKAVATAWGRPLLRLDAGSLYNSFIGESEKRLREALKQAEAMAPVILWIDEIEKAFASASASTSGGDGGLSKRMFGTLLTWMQEHVQPVFLIATANDIAALPPELLRKGRFDEIFFVDLPTLEARAQIFSIHLKKRKRDPKKFDLHRLAEAAEGFSGAEIEQAIATALINAWNAQPGGVELTTDILVESLRNSPPLSVTMSEKIEDLREWSRGRCVPAD